MKFTVKPAAGSSGSSGSSKGSVVVLESPVLTSKSIGEVRRAAAAGKADDPATAAMIAAADDPYMVRFLGNWYTKVREIEGEGSSEDRGLTHCKQDVLIISECLRNNSGWLACSLTSNCPCYGRCSWYA